jgi:hypothetical protein
MLPDPVGALSRFFETFGGAVTGIPEAILEEEVLLRDDARHVDAPVVANATTFLIRSLQVRETGFGDLALADGPVRVAMKGWEDIDISSLAEVAAITGGCQGGGGKEERESREREVHFDEMDEIERFSDGGSVVLCRQVRKLSNRW